MTTYEDCADHTEAMTKTFTEDHRTPVIMTDLTNIRKWLNTLKIHHRASRSINLIGTALKVIASTPDINDWEQIKFNQEQLMKTDEGQTELNIKFQERLNELANAMNQVQKFETDRETQLLEIILAKNRIVITDLENILKSLTLAKLNIVSPAILDSSDIGEFRDRHPIDVSLIELLEVSSISVFQNSEILHFLIKFPSFKFICKKITVYPVQHQKKILNFENGNLVVECPKRNLNIGFSKTTVGAIFCRELQNGSCAQQIVSGAIAHCSTLPGHHGTHIVNDVNMTITDDQGRDQKISGTYLVTYSNKVALNGTWFVNELGSSIRKPAVSAMAILNITTHQNRLSLPFLHELSLSSLHHIGTLRVEHTLGSFLSNSFALLAAFLLCSTVWVS